MRRIRLSTAGESHGPGLTAILQGLPAGLLVDFDLLARDLARRQHGHGRGQRMQIEQDTVDVQGGVRYGDAVQIVAWLDRLGSRGMRFAYEVRRGDDLCTSGATEHVWVEKASGKPCRTPERLREPFAKLAVPAPA